MKISNYILKNFIFVILIKILFSNDYSEILKKIKVEGNKRISDETVVMFSSLKLGDEINSSKLNDALKDLYYTDYFKNVSINFDKGILILEVQENPIIQSIKINGVESKRIISILKDVTIKLEKYPFVENKINDQVILIKNILKSNGYYFVELKTSIIQNNNNTVNLTYDIELGKIAKIKKLHLLEIKFIEIVL